MKIMKIHNLKNFVMQHNLDKYMCIKSASKRQWCELKTRFYYYFFSGTVFCFVSLLLKGQFLLSFLTTDMNMDVLENFSIEKIFTRLSKGGGYTVRLYTYFFLMFVHRYFFEECSDFYFILFYFCCCWKDLSFMVDPF